MTQRGRGRRVQVIEGEIHHSIVIGERTLFVNVDPKKFQPYDKVRVTVELLARTRKG